jgi:hypothetical protein
VLPGEPALLETQGEAAEVGDGDALEGMRLKDLKKRHSIYRGASFAIGKGTGISEPGI